MSIFLSLITFFSALILNQTAMEYANSLPPSHEERLNDEYRSLTCRSLIEAFNNKGFVEYENIQFSGTFYDRLYAEFEEYLSFIEEDAAARKQLDLVRQEFEKRGYKNQIGFAPIGIADTEFSGKKHKIYFHFTEEYASLVKELFPALAEKAPIKQFFCHLIEICRHSRATFDQTINTISLHHPEVKKLFEGYSPLVKVIRYNPSEQYGSHPHVDFSGLSILMDNSELGIMDESLIIGAYKEDIVISELKAPKRTFSRGLSTSNLLIPGLGLKLKGIAVPPTPHAVLAQNANRHSLIIFAMIPNLEVTYDQIRVKL